MGSELSLSKAPDALTFKIHTPTVDFPYTLGPSGRQLEKEWVLWLRKEDGRSRLGLDLSAVKNVPRYVTLLKSFVKEASEKVPTTTREIRIESNVPTQDEIERHGLWITVQTASFGVRAKSLGRWMDETSGMEIYDAGVIFVLGGGQKWLFDLMRVPCS